MPKRRTRCVHCRRPIVELKYGTWTSQDADDTYCRQSDDRKHHPAP